jgi:hypothetical protein
MTDYVYRKSGSAAGTTTCPIGPSSNSKPPANVMFAIGLPDASRGADRGATAHRLDQAASHHGSALGGASALRNRRFESAFLQRRVVQTIGSSPDGDLVAHLIPNDPADTTFESFGRKPLTAS